MSTRCQTIIDGHHVTIYRHGDGYPDGESGVLYTLLPLLREFKKYRGWDPDYMAAQITWLYKQDMYNAHAGCVERSLKYDPKSDVSGYEQMKYLGVGVEQFTGEFHGDEEYIYIVYDGWVDVRTTIRTFFWGTPTLEHTKRLKVVNFDGTIRKAAPNRHFKPKATKGTRAHRAVAV